MSEGEVGGQNAMPVKVLLFSPGTGRLLNACRMLETRAPAALPPPPGPPPGDSPASSPGLLPRPPPPSCPAPAPPLQDVLADGGAMVEVVEADGDAVPENEGAPVLLFVGAETLLEILVGLEATAQLHGRPLSAHQGLVPRSTPGFRGHI